MQVEYKRDISHNYLLINNEEEIDTASYQVRMIIGNVIPHILKCRLSGLNGRMRFCYDITSRQSLETFFEDRRLKTQDLQMIFGGCIKILEEMTEYLMSPELLLIDPGYIYMDAENKELYFCCLAGYEKTVQEQLLRLTEYLLPKLDHSDEKAVTLGYGIYRKVMADTLVLEEIKELIYKREEEKEESREEFKMLQTELPIIETTPPWEEIPVPKETAKKKKLFLTAQRAALILCLLSTLAILCIMSLCYLGYLSWICAKIVLGIVILGMGAALIVMKIPERKRAVSSGRKEKNILPEPEGFPTEENFSVFSFPEKEEEEQEREPALFGQTEEIIKNSTHGTPALVGGASGQKGAVFLGEDPVLIGKLPDAVDAIVPCPTVSRIHARIRCREGDYYLSDLNSKNGTSVNERLLKPEEEILLKDQDRICFGEAEFIFVKEYGG